jgi:hypothetical protein
MRPVGAKGRRGGAQRRRRYWFWCAARYTMLIVCCNAIWRHSSRVAHYTTFGADEGVRGTRNRKPSMNFTLSKGRKWASHALRLFPAQKTLGCWCCVTFLPPPRSLYVYGFMIRSPLAFDWATLTLALSLFWISPSNTLWMHKMCRLFTVYIWSVVIWARKL